MTKIDEVLEGRPGPIAQVTISDDISSTETERNGISSGDSVVKRNGRFPGAPVPKLPKKEGLLLTQDLRHPNHISEPSDDDFDSYAHNPLIHADRRLSLSSSSLGTVVLHVRI